jgi:ParB/RepB/Spo0J family partition protein
MSAASAAFGSQSGLSLDATQAAVPPDQKGRRRLPNSYLIRREQLAADPTQPRKIFDEQELSELAASIQSRGIKQPLTVRWDIATSKYMVIDGGRRFLASERLGLAELPCWIQEGDSKDVLVDQIVHNWQRAELRPEETADALARLRDEFALSQKRISELTGKPTSEISKFLAIHDRVTPEVQQLAREQSETDSPLTMRHLYNISKLDGATAQKELASEVQTKRLTALETEQLVTKRLTRGERPRTRFTLRAFVTAKAKVTITFQKQSVSTDDLIAALDEVRAQLRQHETD